MSRYEYQKEYRKKNSERLRRYRDSRKEITRKTDKEHYYRTKDRHREIVFKRKYGISFEDYLHLTEIQFGNCAICGKKETVLSKNGDIKLLAVDHNHTTLKVRGLLCQRCNQAIGLLDEDTQVLMNAIKYLQSC